MRELTITQYVEMADDRVAKRIEELENWLVRDYVKLMGNIEMCETLGIPCEYNRRSVAEQRYIAEQELRKLTGRQKLPRYKTYISL